MKRLGVKERVIKAASHLFYYQGYNQTGINQIIEESNVAKASMYQHFRSKEDIAVAYLAARHTMWVSKLLNFIANKKTNKTKLIASFDYLIEWLEEDDFRGCGFQNIFVDLPEESHKIKAQVVYHKNELGTLVYELLNNETQYSPKEVKQIRDEILVLMEGAIILSQIQKSIWPIKAGKSACKKLLI
jgi:AcrR family transcriptional regulator